MPLSFNESTKRFEIRTDVPHLGGIPHSKGSELVFAAGFKWDKKKRLWWTRSDNVAARLVDRARMSEEIGKRLQEVAAVQETSANWSSALSLTEDPNIPVPEGLSYYEFQKVAIEYAAIRPATLLAEEMGLGKSIEVLGLINKLGLERILVICPASLKINWRRESEKWLVNPLRTLIVEGSALKDAQRDLFCGSLFMIMSYGAFSRAPKKLGVPDIGKIRASNLPAGELSKKYSLHVDDIAYIRRYRKQRKGIVERLHETEWDLLVMDEVHFLKSRDSKRTLAVKRLAKPIPRLLGLTGTPVPNRTWEIWQPLNILDPEEWSRFDDFLQRYCNGQQQRVDDPARAKLLNELIEEELQHHRLRPTLMIRRMKKDVLPELPPKIVQIVELGAEQFRKELAEEAKAEGKWESEKAKIEKQRDSFPKGSSDYKDAIKRLNSAHGIHFSDMSRVRRLMAVAKAPQAAQHIADTLDDFDGKLAVWLHHRDVADIVIEKLEAYGLVTILGKDSLKHRQESVDRFQTDPSVRVCVGSLLAAGVGLNLTAAHLVCFVELDWTPGNVSQAEDRHHRIGTEADRILIQYIVVNGSLDAKMAKTLVEKQESISATVDAQAQPAEARPEEAAIPGKETILMVDAMPLLSKHYYASLKDDRDRPHALYGLFDSIRKAIAKFQPKYALIAMDSRGRTFRHVMYPEYKANRDPTPEGLSVQIEQVTEVARAMRLHVARVASYEADDIIGTLSRLAGERGLQSLIFSTDKDMYQLVDDDTFMIKPPEMDVIDCGAVEEILPGISPDTMVDYLGLCGDRSDNIPGCKGIGDKFARQYIAQFGSLEALLARKGEVEADGKRKSLFACEEDILLSKRLAEIFREVPGELPLRLCELTGPHSLARSDLERLGIGDLLEEAS